MCSEGSDEDGNNSGVCNAIFVIDFLSIVCFSLFFYLLLLFLFIYSFFVKVTSKC